FFFFQAEDGIRDFHVTGVQTCALPISKPHIDPLIADEYAFGVDGYGSRHCILYSQRQRTIRWGATTALRDMLGCDLDLNHSSSRSEERRVGKECRSWRGRECDKKREIN